MDHIRGVDRNDAARAINPSSKVRTATEARWLAALTLAPGIIAGSALLWLVGEVYCLLRDRHPACVLLQLAAGTTVSANPPLLWSGVRDGWGRLYEHHWRMVDTAALERAVRHRSNDCPLESIQTVPWDRPRGFAPCPFYSVQTPRNLTIALVFLQYLSVIGCGLSVTSGPAVVLGCPTFYDTLSLFFVQTPTALPRSGLASMVLAYAFVHGEDLEFSMWLAGGLGLSIKACLV